MTYIGLILSIIGSLLIIVTPFTPMLILGRIIQGYRHAIMPSTLAIIKTYYQGSDRQRALSFWSIGSWGSGFASLFGGMIDHELVGRIYIISIIVAI